jgi:hypothetical protein
MFLKAVFRRHPRQIEVKPGDCYRRPHGRGVTETATVLDLRTDTLGIPHVRFQVRFEREASEHIETGLRMLALAAFRNAYCATAA